MDFSLESFLGGKGLSLVEVLGKGHSSHVFLVENRQGKRFVAKRERADSTRFRMVERESKNLERANRVSVGPKLVAFDLGRRVILMEFIQGKTFSEWLFSEPSKKQLGLFIKDLQGQAASLDRIGLDHGQLAGRGRNILVRKGKPVIIDFEKASSERKCHNASTIEAFLFRNPHGAVAAKVGEIMQGGQGLIPLKKQALPTS